MAYFNQKITLDVAGNYVPFYKYIKQGDGDSLYLNIKVIAGGAQVVPGNGDTATIRVSKPDRTNVLNPATIEEDGTVTVRITRQMTAAAGIAKADVSITGSSGDVLSTVTFFLDVDEAPGVEGVTSTNEFLLLTQMIAAGNALIGDYSSALEQVEAIHSEIEAAAESAGESAEAAEDAKNSAEDSATLAESYAKVNIPVQSTQLTRGKNKSELQGLTPSSRVCAYGMRKGAGAVPPFCQ